MGAQLDASYEEFSSKTGHVRRWLMLQGEETGGGFSPELAANVRGWSLVWMSACAEQFWQSFLHATCAEFSSMPAPFHRRRIRAQAIYVIDEMFAGTTKDLVPRWEKSFNLLEKLVKADRKTSTAAMPYDGKTVRPKHLDLLWSIFDLPGSSFPSMIHRQSLETLADDRNDIAHGHRLPATVGRLRTRSDVDNTLRRLEETFEAAYLSVSGLLRG
jgi:hypothetical protein